MDAVRSHSIDSTPLDVAYLCFRLVAYQLIDQFILLLRVLLKCVRRPKVSKIMTFCSFSVC